MNIVLGTVLGFTLLLLTDNGIAQEVEVYQPEQMQADLEKFKKALLEIHPGTLTHQSAEEFEALIDTWMLETSGPLEATAFYRIVLKLIASIHDGHTQAYAFGKLGRIINSQNRLPFQVYIREDRIFITKDMSSQGISEGSEIIALDGHLSNEILSEILLHYSSDGQSYNGMHHWMGGPYKPFYRIYPEVFGERTSYNLVYRDYKTNGIVTTQIDGVSKSTYEKMDSIKYATVKVPEDVFNFNINEEENYAYLKISRFFKNGFDEPENTYPDFYKSCFEKIAIKGIQNLIIDLRKNGGGKASNAAYLLQYLIDESITPAQEILTLGNDEYFLKKAEIELNLDESFGLESKIDGTFKVTKKEVLRELMVYNPIDEYKYKGSVTVLIDGGTTSAAGIAAGLLREHTDATFIGEETYGYAGISNGVRQISIKGDRTETAIYLPLLHAKYKMNEHTQRRGVVPDYHISSSVHDILNSRDVVLEFVTEELLSRGK